jgi:co-chaperonin GroES (HSP10)
VGKPPGMVGLIHIPDTGKLSQATGCRCEVVAVGPGCMDKHFRRIPCQSKVGDIVYVKAYGSHPACETEIEVNGETLYVDRERNILGLLS